MVQPRSKLESRNLVCFIILYYLSIPILILSLVIQPLALLYTMCPFLSSCSNKNIWIPRQEDFSLSLLQGTELGCSSSRCWAEINDQFGEPLGSVRRVQRWGLGAERELLSCNLRVHGSADGKCESPDCEECIEEVIKVEEENPGRILELSFEKQRIGLTNNLCKKVLVENTVKTTQNEMNKKILESFLFF